MKTNKGLAQQGDRLLSGIRGAKRIDEKSLWDIVDVLRSTDDLDVAFFALTPDRKVVHLFGKDIIRAIEVFYQASGCKLYGQRRQVIRRGSRRQQMDETLREIVRILKRAMAVSFCLGWRFHGEHAVTLHHSLDLSWELAKERLFDHLAVELLVAVGVGGPDKIQGDEFAELEEYVE